jgi:hypothetical protein
MTDANEEIAQMVADSEYHEPISPRIYVNSFPKSGTHLGLLVARHLVRPQIPRLWIGSFSGNSWTTHWVKDKHVLDVVKGQQSGTFMIGHMGYKDIYWDAMEEMNTCMLFIYRDLRDVAVSQTYHIENPHDNKCHPNKKLYMDMESHEARLKAVIEGIDIFAGIIDRWELYAPWLDVPGILPIKYEDMRLTPDIVAETAVDYVVERTLRDADFIPIFVNTNLQGAITKSIELQNTTEYSTSFRKGLVGGWEDEFTPELKDLFKEKAGDWLMRLGYEKDNNW